MNLYTGKNMYLSKMTTIRTITAYRDWFHTFFKYNSASGWKHKTGHWNYPE